MNPSAKFASNVLSSISLALVAVAMLLGWARFSEAAPAIDCGPPFNNPPDGWVCYQPWKCNVDAGQRCDLWTAIGSQPTDPNYKTCTCDTL